MIDLQDCNDFDDNGDDINDDDDEGGNNDFHDIKTSEMKIEPEQLTPP